MQLPSSFCNGAVVARRRVVAADFIGIADAISICIIGEEYAVLTGLTGRGHVGAQRIVLIRGCRGMPPCCRGNLHFVRITDAIGVGIVVDDDALTGLALAVDEGAGAASSVARPLKLQAVGSVQPGTSSPSPRRRRLRHCQRSRLLTRLACAVGEGAGTVVVGGDVAEVAGRGVVQPDFAVANAVPSRSLAATCPFSSLAPRGQQEPSSSV